MYALRNLCIFPYKDEKMGKTLWHTRDARQGPVMRGGFVTGFGPPLVVVCWACWSISISTVPLCGWQVHPHP